MPRWRRPTIPRGAASAAVNLTTHFGMQLQEAQTHCEALLHKRKLRWLAWVGLGLPHSVLDSRQGEAAVVVCKQLLNAIVLRLDSRHFVTHNPSSGRAVFRLCCCTSKGKRQNTPTAALALDAGAPASNNNNQRQDSTGWLAPYQCIMFVY